jgi:uncharacterized membrane protein YphA (DoxX/SURF4 family)
MMQRGGWLRRVDDTGVPLGVARLVLGGMFVFMGLSKALDPIDFLKFVRMYDILPETPPYFLNLTAVILPVLEVVCGVALLLGVAVRGAGLTLFGMLLVFTAALISQSLDIHAAKPIAYCDVRFDCGCGTGEVYICRKLAENAALTLLALLASLSRSRRFCLSAWLSRVSLSTDPERSWAAGS